MRKKGRNGRMTSPASEERRMIPKLRMGGFPDLREEMDRIWEAMMAARLRPFQYLARQSFPAIDVFEKDGKLQVRAELPGMTEKDIEIEVAGDALTISGEKKQETEVKEENYSRSERIYGQFSRQVALPPGADPGQSTALFKDGVLEIEVPLKAAEPRKRIEIRPTD
jgi:HSP20 family protein